MGLRLLTTVIVFLFVTTVVIALPSSSQLQDKIHAEKSPLHINVTFQSNNYTLYGEIYYPANLTQPLPAIIVCEGTGGYISMYSWLPQALAIDDYIAFIVDFPGQGKSQGFHPIHGVFFPWLNLYLRLGAFHESTIHYLNGDCVQATKDAISYLTEDSPVSLFVDDSRIGLIGHSLGGLVVTETSSQDPRVKAVVALSHATPECVPNITIPLQLLGGDLELAPSSKSIPVLLESYANANPPKELLFIAGGMHLGFTTVFGPLCPCPTWQKPCCLQYVLGWFDWFLKSDSQAYESITTGNPRLSGVLHSRYNFGDGDCVLQRC